MRLLDSVPSSSHAPDLVLEEHAIQRAESEGLGACKDWKAAYVLGQRGSDMAERICISREGVFEIDGRSYRIPEYFSTKEMLSYRTLLEPIPDVHGGKSLTAKGRVAAQKYFLWRAVACLVPGFRTSVPQSLSLGQLESIHRWIAEHHPDLSVDLAAWRTGLFVESKTAESRSQLSTGE